MKTGRGIWKGLSRNGFFLLLPVWSLSWDNSEALIEAADGGRTPQKGLFTHVWCLGWEDPKARAAGGGAHV